MPLNIDWSVSINGENLTSRLNPYVMEIEVVDGSGKDADTARITLADDGRLILPTSRAPIIISILGTQVFDGILKTPRLSDAKGQGGRMILEATGHDTEGPGKEGRHFAMEDCTLGEYVKEFGNRAGYTVTVDPELAKIKRTWWGPEGRSFHFEMDRLAKTFGATRKYSNKKATLAKRGKGMTAGGKQMPTVYATRGENLINNEIEPFVTSEAIKDARLSGFDRKAAKFFEEKVDIRAGLTGSKAASSIMRGKAADKQDAEDRAKGRTDQAERERGGGSVEIDINPMARAEGTCIIRGQRPGVDGSYRIESATHTVRAGDSASTTKLQLKQPGDDVGKDDRKSGE